MVSSTSVVVEETGLAEAQKKVDPYFQPVEQPRSWFVRLLYRSSIKRYGKVPIAFRVVYARAPALVLVALVSLVLEHLLRVSRPVRRLVQFVVAKGHGCEFCADFLLAEALRANLGREKFAHFEEFETHPAFDPAERAAIAYAQALSVDRSVPADILMRLRQHFSEREVIEIVWLAALESYFNAMAVPLGLKSDRLAALATEK